jgi:type I restriction enzyme S subunit
MSDASEDISGIGLCIEIANPGLGVVGGLHTIAMRDEGKVFADIYRGLQFQNPTIKNQIVAESTGTTVFGISKRKLQQILLPLPPLPEQRRIAAVLSSVDGLLAGLDALLAKKEAIKAGVMEELLTGERRLAGYEGDWDIKTFGDITQPSTKRINPLKLKQDFQVIELEHIESKTGVILGSSRSHSVVSQKTVFNRGDVLYGKLRPYLRKYARPFFNGACSTEIWVLTGSSAVVSDYLFYIVQSSAFNKITSLSVGTKMPRAEWSSVKEYELPLPPLPEQRAIATVLSTLDAELAALRARRAKVAAVKAGLLGGLLSGEVRV